MVKIKPAEIANAVEITELLNKTTLHLHEKRINQWSYPWNSSIIEDDIKNGHVYVLTIDDLICGTFSVKDADGFDYLLIEQGSRYLYRIAILPEYQGMNLGREVLNYVCEYSRSLKKALYLDCWAGNKKLREFYSNAGFNFMGDFPEEDYFVTVFKY